MNMPPPFTRKNYNKQSKLLNTVVKAVAGDTMCNAAAVLILHLHGKCTSRRGKGFPNDTYVFA